MADKLSQIIAVTITRDTATVSQAGFGKALIMGDLAETYNEGYPAAWATRVVEVAELSELGAAGHNFDTTKAIYKAAQAYFSQAVKPEGLYIGYYNSGAAETMTTGLAAVRAAAGGDDWYAIACTDRTSGALGDQWELAQLMETENRIFVTASADANMKSGADVTSTAALAANAGYNNTAVIYHSEAATTTDVKGWADMAWLGRMLPTEPGDGTWAYKTLVGINPDNALTTAECTAITGSVHYSTYYDTIAGVDGTRFGNVTSGLWLDSIRLAHWCVARIQEAIYRKLATLGKIPYTDDGVNIVKAEIRRVLNRKVPNAIADISYVTAPKVADVDAADKLARLLPDVKFAYTEAGAIHKVNILGTVSI